MITTVGLAQKALDEINGVSDTIELMLEAMIGYRPEMRYVIKQTSGGFGYYIHGVGNESLTTATLTGNKLLCRLFESGNIYMQLSYVPTEDGNNAITGYVSVRYTHPMPSGGENGYTIGYLWIKNGIVTLRD